MTLYWSNVIKTRKWHELITMPGENIYRDDTQSTAYNRIRSESIDESIKIYMKIIALEILSFFIATIEPFYQYINYGT